jgi:hypothetical protein
LSKHTQGGMIALVAAVLLVSPAYGQTRLANVKALSCVFTMMASGTWKDGQVLVETQPASLKFRFEAIDADDGTARAVGAFGPAEIILKLTPGALHFMQPQQESAMYLTTVFNVQSSPGKLRAVHTRHEYTLVNLPGFTSTPEQYYGECTPDP